MDRMQYISDLNNEQKEAFIKALVFVMCADGAKEEEKAFIKLAMDVYSVNTISLEDVVAPVSAAEVKRIAVKIEDERARRYLVREMIALGFSDGDFSENEMEIVFDIGEALGVSEERINDMIDWAVAGLEWQLEGIDLIEREDIDDFDFDDED